MIRKNRRWPAIIGAFVCAFPALAQQRSDDLFRDVEIRVIRQKYFQKSMRPEIAAHLGAIMNRSFIYTVVGNIELGFHLSEHISIYGDGGMGFSMNKSDCSVLGKEFDIEPVVDDLRKWYGGGISYTPVYGKYQLTSGELIYFDWFFNFSGGMADVNKRTKGTCIPNVADQSDSSTELQIAVSTGQRYFLSKNTAAIWNVKLMKIQDPAGGTVVSNAIDNIFFTIGMSYFL